MEQTPCSEASREQNFSLLLWKPKSHYPLYKSPLPVFVLSQLNPLYPLPPFVLKVQLNVILLSMF
jgi:hypothetical protein